MLEHRPPQPPQALAGCPTITAETQARSAPTANHDAKRAALDLALDLDPALDLRRPVKHAGRNSTGIWGVNRQGCRFSRPAPWMARGGGPPNTWRITGTPSLGEVPSVGARALWLLWGFSKVTRRKGGTISSHYPSNGYVLGLIQHPGRLSGRLRRQASSHIWIAGRQLVCGRLSGRLRRQASSHILDRGGTVRLWSAVRSLSQASQLPHF